MSPSVMIEWMPLLRYCELYGETPDAVDKRVRNGYWLRDVHVRLPAGSKQTWINIEAVNDWAAGRTPKIKRPR
ncbi:hypothetical protein J2W32_001485 [Variovorax boronicumulans]|uniref:Excisionase n=1 Tax=Variovorax boronicumulans TaxID=436515 RepID=A0AAW8D1S3_9BURK|nr:excisionase [Variovorax boronicumulans]MDP9893210.1 hypothetical protein [Variovorax boronicumulans]MDQ0052443.1 hypothetical protein [Variovorax boronicumulans]